jgi:hypothetical protein
MSETILVTGLSNREFLDRYSGAGRVGLSGGTTLIDRAICRAQRHLHPRKRWGMWSHAFLFEGLRADGHHWVMESDLQILRRHIQLGVQENRVTKFHDAALHGSLAVLDFGLSAAKVDVLIREGLELVAGHERYSVRELFGTLLALKRHELRSQANVLARERSVFCSAFVQHLFRKAGLDLAPGVDIKNTAPQDIANTPLPHTAYVLVRDTPRDHLGHMQRRMKARIRVGLREARRRVTRTKAG